MKLESNETSDTILNSIGAVQNGMEKIMYIYRRWFFLRKSIKILKLR